MTDLTDYLRDRIAEDGPLTVADYMGLALCHHDGGYYMTRDPFGTDGDFTTAPRSVSQMFGELIGLWCGRHLAGHGRRRRPCIWSNWAPGRGTLMSDAVRAARTVPAYHAALQAASGGDQPDPEQGGPAGTAGKRRPGRTSRNGTTTVPRHSPRGR